MTTPGAALRRAGRAARVLGRLAVRWPALLRPWRFPAAAEALKDGFAADAAAPSAADYEDLFRYFAAGWCAYRTTDRAGAFYPGLPSWSGARVDALEGFARIMPLFAAWYAGGREPVVALPSGAELPLAEEFALGLTAGTDRRAPGYWGDMTGRSDQRIVEAADVALALWLFRDAVWPALSERRRKAVVDWLAQVESRPGLDNNWHLFFVLIDRVLAALGHPGRVPSAHRHYRRAKDFHLGDGWFSDGPDGRVDFYSAWGFHYALYWIDRIDPRWDAAYIADCRRRFLAGYRHLIGPHGLPMLGRSLCYRLAAPAPLVFGHDRHPDVVPAGEARRALDAVWCHFVRHGALSHGVPTQGYYGEDARLVDPYSGPASSLWSLRSLVAAFALPREHPFWRVAATALPVEQYSYEVEAAGGAWRVCGDRASGRVSVEVLANPAGAAPALAAPDRLQVLRRFAEGRAHWPRNDEAKYGRRLYRSDAPFCVGPDQQESPPDHASST